MTSIFQKIQKDFLARPLTGINSRPNAKSKSGALGLSQIRQGLLRPLPQRCINLWPKNTFAHSIYGHQETLFHFKGSCKNKFAEVRVKYAMYSADLSEQNHPIKYDPQII